VVESGEIEIVDESGEAPRVLAVLGRGEFTGDVAHLTGGAALATAVARRESHAYEVSAEGVREILNRFPALGDVILQAFIARRHLLRESGRFTGVRVVGSRYSRDTLRILDFLSKNRVPYDHPHHLDPESVAAARGHHRLCRSEGCAVDVR
jgi:thioredoxin reductase (NADPH)